MKATTEVQLCSQYTRRCAKFTALLDSGADLSFIREDAVEEGLGKASYTRFPKPLMVRTAGRQKNLKVIGAVSLQMAMDNCKTELPRQFLVAEDLMRELIVGVDLLEAIGVELTFRPGGKETVIRVKECPKEEGIPSVFER